MEINENDIREKVRKNLETLDSSLSDSRPPDVRSTEAEMRIRHLTERIVAEETESFFVKQGLVKYESTTGRVYWLTPRERDERIARRAERRHKRKKRDTPPIDRKKAVAVACFLLVVIVLVWILFETGIFNVAK